jgi:hypothetical protein
MNGDAMCKSEPGAAFGACTVHTDFDCDGNIVGTDCNVWYDPSCASGGGWWNGPVLFGDYNCVAFIYVGCGNS